jgi:hypothetical protein
MLTRDKKEVMLWWAIELSISWVDVIKTKIIRSLPLPSCCLAWGEHPFWGWEACGGQQHCIILLARRYSSSAFSSLSERGIQKLCYLFLSCGGDFGCEPLMSLSKAAARDKAEFAFLLPRGPGAISARRSIHATHATFVNDKNEREVVFLLDLCVLQEHTNKFLLYMTISNSNYCKCINVTKIYYPVQLKY